MAKGGVVRPSRIFGRSIRVRYAEGLYPILIVLPVFRSLSCVHPTGANAQKVVRNSIGQVRGTQHRFVTAEYEQLAGELLADVEGPVVQAEALDQATLDGRRPPPRMLAQEVARQPWHVLLPVTQGRQPHGEAVEAREPIGTQALLRHRTDQGLLSSH